MSAQPSEILQKLLHLIGFDARIEEHATEDGLTLDVVAEDSDRLIGRQGQTLSDLQYLLNRIVFERDEHAPKITVDVGGYRAEARASLLKRAHEAAEEVRRSGQMVELEPMTAYDRRIVHHALRDDPDLETESLEIPGTSKKVILLRPRRA